MDVLSATTLLPVDSEVALCPIGAYHTPTRTLIVADLHLGYEEELARKGIALQQSTSAQLCDTIMHHAHALEATDIILNGDTLHATTRKSAHGLRELRALLRTLRTQGFHVHLICGNHDHDLARILPQYVTSMSALRRLGRVVVAHGDEAIPLTPGIELLILGHEHPALRLSEEGIGTRQFPCFLEGKIGKTTILVLPALAACASGTDVVRARSTYLAPQLQSIEQHTLRAHVHVQAEWFTFPLSALRRVR